MKKLLLFFILLFSFFFSFAQFPNPQTIGSPTTLWDQQGAARAKKGLINGSYTDTTQANAGNIDFYPGAQIFTTSDNSTWVRNSTATRWIPISGAAVTNIINIFNTSITNTTVINQTDSSVTIQICTGANSCDTFILVTNITNVTYSTTTFINDTTIQVCGLDTVTSIIECDTLIIPTQVLYTFQKGLNETVAGIVNFGSDISNPISLLQTDGALIGLLGDTIATFHPNGLLTFNEYNSSHNDGLISKILGVDAYGNVLAGSLPTQDSCGIFGGLVVTWDSLLVFDVSPGTWASCCDLVTRNLATTDSVQLDPSDPSNPRFDAIIVTQTGVDKVTGVASANPAFPDIPDCAIVLAYVLINAGDLVPADVCQGIIYDTTGGSEWDTVTTIASVNFSNNTNVAHAPYSASAGAWTNNQYIQFNTQSFTPITVANYSSFKFYLKKKATFAANVQIRITWYNGSSPVSVALNIATAAYGYVRTNTNYEIFTIPLPDFGFTGTQATGVRFTFTNSNASGFYLDWVQLQGCLTPPPAAGGIQQWLGTGNTLFDVVEAFPNGPNEAVTFPLNNAAAYRVWGNNTNVAATPSYIQVDLSTAMVTGLLPVTNLSIGNAGDLLTMVGGLPTWQSAATGYDTTIVRLPLVALPGTVRDTLTLPISVGAATDSALFLNRGTGLLEMGVVDIGLVTAGNGLTDSSGRVILGGTLYKPTYIEVADNTFQILVTDVSYLSISENNSSLSSDNTIGSLSSISLITQDGVQGAEFSLTADDTDDDPVQILGNSQTQRISIQASAGLTLTSYGGGALYQNDTSSFKPLVVGTDGKVYQSSWFGSGGGGGGINIYNTDSLIASDRTVDLNGNFLKFQEGGTDFLSIDPTIFVSFFLQNNAGAESALEVNADGANSRFDLYSNDGSNQVDIQGNPDPNTITHTAGTHIFQGTPGGIQFSSYATGGFYQNDTSSYKPLVVDINGNIYQSSWAGGSTLFALTGTNTATGNVVGDLDGNTLTIQGGDVIFNGITIQGSGGPTITASGDPLVIENTDNDVFITAGDGENVILLAGTDGGPNYAKLWVEANTGFDFESDGIFSISVTGAATYTAASHTFIGAVSIPSITNNTGLAAGTYIPTLSNTTNVAASTAYACQYMRVGNTVTVSGKVDIDVTLTATSTVLGVSLPIASAIANANELGGTAFCPTIAALGAAILGDAGNDRATIQLVSTDTNNNSFYFTFSYTVL